MFWRKLIWTMALMGVLAAAMISTGCRSSTPTSTPTPTTGGLQFVVTDPDKNILNGVKIMSEEQPTGQLKVTGITTGDASGVTFSNLLPGQYVFQFSRADYQAMSLAINVVAGQTPGTTISLAKLPGAITITPSTVTY